MKKRPNPTVASLDWIRKGVGDVWTGRDEDEDCGTDPVDGGRTGKGGGAQPAGPGVMICIGGISAGAGLGSQLTGVPPGDNSGGGTARAAEFEATAEDGDGAAAEPPHLAP